MRFWANLHRESQNGSEDLNYYASVFLDWLVEITGKFHPG